MPSSTSPTSDTPRRLRLLLNGLSAGDVAGPGLAGADPRHHGPESVADLLDRVLGRLLAERVEHGPPDLVLEDPFLGELTRLDLAEDLPHLGARLVGDDARAARHVPVLGGIGDG